MRSERGPHNVLQEVNDDLSLGLGAGGTGEGVGGGGGGGGGDVGGGEVPMDLKTSAQSALRAESQKV